MVRRLAKIGSIVLLAFSSIATACGGAPPSTAGAELGMADLIKQAKSEGTLVWYNSYAPGPSQKVIDAFQQKYGIPVKDFRLTSGPLGQRFAAEASAGRPGSDVMTFSDPAFADNAVTQGWFAKLTVKDLPASAQWPKSAWNGTYAGIGVNPVLLAYNTEKVTGNNIPTKWQDLLDPRWKDKLVLADPRSVPTWLAVLHLLNETQGPDYLKGLAAQKFQLVGSIIDGNQLVAAGAKSIIVYTTGPVTTPLIAKGAPLAMTTLNPTTGLLLQQAVTNQAPHPSAAKLFMNFTMTPEIQAVFNGDGGASLLPGVKGAALPKGYTAPDYSGASANKATLVRQVGLG
jgi:iron(III) transport system substrate-binding protein